MRRTTLAKTIVGAFVTVAAFGLVGTQAAYAGEVTGNGGSLKNPDGSLNGASICAFSGLNDTFSGDPDVPDADGFTRTQNWGQIPLEGRQFLTSIGVNPGNACKPGFEE